MEQCEKDFIPDNLAIGTFLKTLGYDAQKISEISGGVINHTFLVALENGTEVVMRLSNPGFQRKTEYEVAALRLSTHTGLPVAKLLHYDVTSNNALNHEFILTSKLPGIPIAKIEDQLSIDQLREIMHDVVQTCTPMWRKQFDAIGQLNDCFQPSPFSDGGHGPFVTCVDYYAAELEFRIAELRKESDFEFVEAASAFHRDIPKMLNAEDDVFVMIHGDLNFENILVDEKTHKVAGIVDWEWCAASPIEGEIISSDFFEYEELKDDFVVAVSEAVGFDVAVGLQRKKSIISIIGGLLSLGAHKRWAARLGWSDAETNEFENDVRAELRSNLGKYMQQNADTVKC